MARFARLSVVFAVTLGVLLFVRPLSSPLAYGQLLIGMLAGIALAPVLLTVARLAGGGRLLGISIGLGNPLRVWLTRQGTFVMLARLPITIYGYGIVGRRPFVRLPHVAFVLGAALIIVAGLVLGAGSDSAFVDGGATGAALLVGLVLAAPGGGGDWRAFAPSYTGELSRTLDDAARASALQDVVRVLELTSTIPPGATPDHLDQLYAMRATALTRVERYAEAGGLLRAELLNLPASAPTARRRLALAATLIAAWEAGDDAGLPARTELPDLLSGPFPAIMPSDVASIRAAASLHGGELHAAYEGAAQVAPRLPRSLRAWPLCTMALAAIELGRPDEARALLAKASALDPAEPRLKYALATLDA